MKLTPHLHWLLYIIFIASCAKQSSPTGGPKDTIPPILEHSLPKKEATNFKGDKLEMTFSELVVLNNPKEQLIITPSIGKEFEVTSKKKTVTLDFGAPLKDSTTYTFNFRDAVQDITEKNPVRNFQIAISTGPYIDSLSISGTITDLLKAKPFQNATIALHPKNDTFSIFKHPAEIFTKTDKSGKFTIDHLKPGTYYLYAFDDKNRNLFADSRSEYYGFLKDSINLHKDTARIALGMVRLDARPLKITSARPYNSYFNIRTSKNLNNFTLSGLNMDKLYYSYGEDQSNIRVYQNIPPGDSLLINLVAQDSIGNKLDTVLYAKFSERDVSPEKFSTAISRANVISDKGLFSATLTFTKPVKEINFDSLYFQVDSLNTIRFDGSNLKWDHSTNTLSIEKRIDRTLFPLPEAETRSAPAKSKKAPGRKYINELRSRKGAFVSIENDSSAAITRNIEPVSSQDLSIILYTVTTNVPQKYLVQLLDKDFNMIRQFESKPSGQFDNLPAGEYILRIVGDVNGNTAWDAGNYLTRTQPEPITYYQSETGQMVINLKTNWEYGPVLIKY
jgi:uncharacterized protein (DUF2141 family)